MKQVTEEQIEAVIERAKHYAKEAIRHRREYEKTMVSSYDRSANMYRDELNGLCVSLEMLGIVADSYHAFYKFLVDARSEQEEEK